MPLNGELSDLSLSELIEFFCNQRKTGRLEVTYLNGSIELYLQSGALVHAQIGMLRGVDAVYYALTQPNASFKFSPQLEGREQTINQPWSSVVLEGLRRMDEGIAPPIAFSERTSEPGEKIIEQPVTKPAAVDRAAVTPQPPANVEAHHEKGLMAAEPPAKAAEASKAPVAIVEHQPAEAAKSEKQNLPAVDRSEPSRTPPPPKRLPATSPLFAEVGPKRSPFGKIVLIAAAVVLLIAGVAVPWGWYSRNQAAGLNSESEKEINQAVPPVASSDTAENVGPVTTSDAPVIADDTANTLNGPSPVNRENRQLEARRTESLRAKTNVAEPALTNSTAPQAADPNQRPKSQTSPSTGGKKVTVQVTYDENGRVTQASGGDATALRIARQKRFPAGKPGSATVTIPIN